MTGAVDKALGFSSQTALEYRTLTNGKMTGYLGALPDDVASFRQFGDTGLFTLDYTAARTSGSIAGGPLQAWARDSDAFLAQHHTLNPAAHGQAALDPNLVTATYADLFQIYGMAPGASDGQASCQPEGHSRRLPEVHDGLGRRPEHSSGRWQDWRHPAGWCCSSSRKSHQHRCVARSSTCISC